jgi:hypothetical protein
MAPSGAIFSLVIMNAIEQALARTAKREARKTLTLEKPQEQVSVAPVVTPEPPVVTKEKPRTLGEIRVQVILPEGSFEFSLFKDAIMSNVSRSRLNKTDFSRAIAAGLAPIVGALR